jgi:peptide/nickel transport system ATP-binding protein
MNEPLLRVSDLRVELDDGAPIVESVSLMLEPGRVLGLVGESGSGKSTVALALLGFARRGARIAGGSVRIDGRELVGLPEAELRSLRGQLVSYVPQEPAAALNPSVRIGDQIAGIVREHTGRRPSEAEVGRAFAAVELPGTRDFQRRFPHQLSGGQQQRVTIAASLVCSPRLVVMDEPTTGLDVVTQGHILDEIARLRQETGVGIVYVSHDLAVVGAIADRIAVMYGGQVVEEGPAAAVLGSARHPYTQGLLASVPDHLEPRRLPGIPGVAVSVRGRPRGCPFAARCPQRVALCEQAMPPLEDVEPLHTVRCHEWRRTPTQLHPGTPLVPRNADADAPVLSVAGLWAHYRTALTETAAVRGVAFAIAHGETLALVGESGSGKTTIARCIAGLHAPSAGTIDLHGVPLARSARQRSREARRAIQIIFQNPYESLNPRQRVGETVAYPARQLLGLSRKEAAARAQELLARVRLPVAMADRYPHELSGGERQRVAIARALAPEPDLLICDEVTSALDVSVQAAVLDLLAELGDDLNVAMLFITHDLGVVASIADRVLVLEHGVVCEEGSVSRVLHSPTDAYTRTLVAAAPRLDAARHHQPSLTATEVHA